MRIKYPENNAWCLGQDRWLFTYFDFTNNLHISWKFEGEWNPQGEYVQYKEKKMIRESLEEFQSKLSTTFRNNNIWFKLSQGVWSYENEFHFCYNWGMKIV